MACNPDGAHPAYMGANRIIIIQLSGSWRREVGRTPGRHGIARPPDGKSWRCRPALAGEWVPVVLFIRFSRSRRAFVFPSTPCPG